MFKKKKKRRKEREIGFYIIFYLTECSQSIISNIMSSIVNINVQIINRIFSLSFSSSFLPSFFFLCFSLSLPFLPSPFFPYLQPLQRRHLGSCPWGDRGPRLTRMASQPPTDPLLASSHPKSASPLLQVTICTPLLLLSRSMCLSSGEAGLRYSRSQPAGTLTPQNTVREETGPMRANSCKETSLGMQNDGHSFALALT